MRTLNPSVLQAVVDTLKKIAAERDMLLDQLKTLQLDWHQTLAERDDLREQRDACVKALRMMLAASDEIAAKFIQKRRTANWSTINDAYLAGQAAIAAAKGKATI